MHFLHLSNHNKLGHNGPITLRDIMKNFWKILASLALGLALSVPAQAVSRLNEALPDSIIVSAGGMEWVWAGPCATLEPSCGTSVLRDNFKIPTAAQWLASFADAAALSSAFTSSSGAPICGSAWFNTMYDHCDPYDLTIGYIWGAPSPISGSPNDRLSESFLVRAVPEPETYAMLLAGLALMGFVARRRKQA